MLICSDVYRLLLGADNKSDFFYPRSKKVIDEFHVMYMYKKIQAEAATTDTKTLEQLLKKFRSVVNERREEYYQEIGEKKAHKLKMKRLQRMLEKMACDRVSPEDLID